MERIGPLNNDYLNVLFSHPSMGYLVGLRYQTNALEANSRSVSFRLLRKNINEMQWANNVVDCDVIAFGC